MDFLGHSEWQPKTTSQLNGSALFEASHFVVQKAYPRKHRHKHTHTPHTHTHFEVDSGSFSMASTNKNASADSSESTFRVPAQKEVPSCRRRGNRSKLGLPCLCVFFFGRFDCSVVYLFAFVLCLLVCLVLKSLSISAPAFLRASFPGPYQMVCHVTALGDLEPIQPFRGVCFGFA